jgi:tRNA-(ms[2]io[6]A)-hydroxylase
MPRHSFVIRAPSFDILAMLSLRSATSPDWLARVHGHLDEVLIDHAHCEKKAAGVAMNLIFAYVDRVELVRRLSEIVSEELSHFHMVLDLLDERGVRFRRLPPSGYGRRLNELVRKDEPGRAIDRLLVAGLIEARSCERFALLARGVGDQKLGAFYGSLFESEARHHATYVQLARLFGREADVHRRLEELAASEAEIVAAEPQPVRMHSA